MVDYEALVIQQMKDLLTYNRADGQSLKAMASAKGFIYAIVDQTGRIHATRRSYGAANRILEKGKFSYFSEAMTNKENLRQTYRVVVVHISQISED